MDPLYGSVRYSEIDDKQISIHIKLNERVKDDVVHFRAPAPADHLTSFSGSELPFPNPDAAFENTPNEGFVKVDASLNATVPLMRPNAYYNPFEDSYTPPHVEIRYVGLSENRPRVWKVVIPYQLPRFRSLGHPSNRNGPTFYHSKRDLTRTQERILRDSSHWNTSCDPMDFWCGKPPQ